jgi:hypothetical protein
MPSSDKFTTHGEVTAALPKFFSLARHVRGRQSHRRGRFGCGSRIAPAQDHGAPAAGARSNARRRPVQFLEFHPHDENALNDPGWQGGSVPCRPAGRTRPRHALSRPRALPRRKTPHDHSRWWRLKRLTGRCCGNWNSRGSRRRTAHAYHGVPPAAEAGLTVRCQLNPNIYLAGVKVLEAEIQAINLKRQDFHGDWNYPGSRGTAAKLRRATRPLTPPSQTRPAPSSARPCRSRW